MRRTYKGVANETGPEGIRENNTLFGKGEKPPVLLPAGASPCGRHAARESLELLTGARAPQASTGPPVRALLAARVFGFF